MTDRILMTLTYVFLMGLSGMLFAICLRVAYLIWTGQLK